MKEANQKHFPASDISRSNIFSDLKLYFKNVAEKMYKLYEAIRDFSYIYFLANIICEIRDDQMNAR